MIDMEDVLPDPVSDEVGPLLAQFHASRAGTSERSAVKAKVIARLRKMKYHEFSGNKMHFALGKVGDSILYRVPADKTGHLRLFRNKLIRIVCVGHIERFIYCMMAGVFMGSVAEYSSRACGARQTPPL